MQKFARLDAANRVIETWSEVEIDGQVIVLSAVHAPDIAAQFVPCPDDVLAGATHDAAHDTWTNLAPPAPDPLPGDPTFTDYPEVSPVEFKLLFTGSERVAIKNARATDAIIDDFMSIMEDPRLHTVNLKLKSNRDALDYLVSKLILTEDRVTQILHGIAP